MRAIYAPNLYSGIPVIALREATNSDAVFAAIIKCIKLNSAPDGRGPLTKRIPFLTLHASYNAVGRASGCPNAEFYGGCGGNGAFLSEFIQ